MTRVVLDTNIYISAFVFGGVPSEALSAAYSEDCLCLLSQPICDEVERVLMQKFAWPLEQVDVALARLRPFAQWVAFTEPLSNIVRDEADHRILECAVAGIADMIVSGDKHLLELRRYRGISILTAREFLDLMA